MGITFVDIQLKPYGPFLWMGYRGFCLTTTEPIRGDSLFFTTKSPEDPGTHSIHLRMMKG